MGKKKKKSPLSAKLTVKELLSRAKAGEIDAYTLLGDKYRKADADKLIHGNSCG